MCVIGVLRAIWRVFCLPLQLLAGSTVRALIHAVSPYSLTLRGLSMWIICTM
jgi:hypothetical protein